jgi:hypothetical protein
MAQDLQSMIGQHVVIHDEEYEAFKAYVKARKQVSQIFRLAGFCLLNIAILKISEDEGGDSLPCLERCLHQLRVDGDIEKALFNLDLSWVCAARENLAGITP